MSTVTRRETQTQTTNHALTDPTGTIEDLAGSLTSSNGEDRVHCLKEGYFIILYE